MNAARATGNTTIMDETREKEKKGVLPHEAPGWDATLLEDTAKEEATGEEASGEEPLEPGMPPDLKAAKNSPSRGGTDPKEVADMLFSAAPPPASTEVPATGHAPSIQEEKGVQSTPNTPLRGASNKDNTPKKRKKRAWLSLSPPGWRKSKEEKENIDKEAEEERAETEDAGFQPAEQTIQTEMPKLAEESKPEAEPKTGTPHTLKNRILDIYELVTVGEGVEGVREAERRNYARAESNDGFSEDEMPPMTQNTPQQKGDEITDEPPDPSPMKGKENEKEEVKVDPNEEEIKAVENSTETQNKEDIKEEETPTPSRKKKWLKKPKINLSFNKKKAKKKVDEEALPNELESPDQETLLEKEPETPLEDSPTAVEEDKQLQKSTHDITEEEKAAAEPRGYDVQEFSNFGMVMVGLLFCLMTLIGAFLVEHEASSVLSASAFLNSVCTPTPRGTVLDAHVNGQSTFEAPWWAPAPLKSKGLFQFVCGNRPRTKLEWIPEKQSRNINLYHLVLSDLDCSDPKSAVLFDQKHSVSALVEDDGIVVSNKKGKSFRYLGGPWTATES